LAEILFQGQYIKNVIEKFKILPQLQKRIWNNSARLPCTAGISRFWTKMMTPFWMLRTAVEKPYILRCVDAGHSDGMELPAGSEKKS